MVTLSSLFKKLCPKDDGRGRIGRTRLTRFTLPETNSKFAPENGWLEYDRFLLGWPTFRGELLVLGRVPCTRSWRVQTITPMARSTRSFGQFF